MMCEPFPALLYFLKLLSGWEFCATYLKSLSGRLLTGWTPLFARWKAFETCTSLLVKVTFRGSPRDFSLLNCYGTYVKREAFWHNAMIGGIFYLPNLIFAGDLNFTINDAYILDFKACLDSLDPFFS